MKYKRIKMPDGGPTDPKPNYNFSVLSTPNSVDSLMYDADFRLMQNQNPSIVDVYTRMKKYGIPVGKNHTENINSLNAYEDALNQMPPGKKLGIQAGAKAFPDGGDPTTTTIARKDIMSVPGAITQVGGVNKASVYSPYQFVSSQGLINYDENTFNRLSPIQRQQLSQQAYLKAGMQQVGDNTFTGTSDQAGFAAGGNPQYDAITGALSPVISMIPGGQFINMGLDLVGNFLPGKEEKVPYTGEYSLGGRTKYFTGGKPQYELEGQEVVMGESQLEGQSNTSKFGSIAEGPTHDKGGVQGSGGKFILSDRLGIDGSYSKENPISIASHARPIMKSLSMMGRRTADSIDRMGEKLLGEKLNTLKGINKNLLSLREQKKKFYTGGYPEGDPEWMLPDNYGQGTGLNLGSSMTERIPENTMGINTNTISNPNISLNPVSQFSSPNNILNNMGGTTMNKTGVNLVDPSYFANAPVSDAFTGQLRTSSGQPVQGGNKLGASGLNGLGMAISGLGAIGQIATTVAEHKKNLPNENFYEDISARAESTYNDSLNTLNAEKRRSGREINDSYGSLFREGQANSVNVDRAMKNMGYVGRAKAIGDSNLSYDSAIADRKIGLSNLQMQGDTLQAQGRQEQRTSDQMDLANYFTNLGSNISDATGQALNAVKIAQGARSQSQALNMLSQAYPNFTLSELQGMLQIIYKG